MCIIINYLGCITTRIQSDQRTQHESLLGPGLILEPSINIVPLSFLSEPHIHLIIYNSPSPSIIVFSSDAPFTISEIAASSSDQVGW
jgi:hypothetical protein